MEQESELQILSSGRISWPGDWDIPHSLMTGKVSGKAKVGLAATQALFDVRVMHEGKFTTCSWVVSSRLFWLWTSGRTTKKH
jgi:hypothetical protein